MMPASKHGDPQIGVDVHLCTVPPSPSPVPLPTPHTSVVFDPFDYVPILGATVTVCGMKRATAGTGGTAIHVPPGFPFAPKLPDKDDEIFMGSSTVTADGEPFSFTTVPTLSCQIVGMPSPPRLKKKGPPKLMQLPTTVNLAIPTNVTVGGPPTISLMGLAFKFGFAALGRFARSGIFKRFRQRLFKNLKPGFLKCTILRAEPVNILTGEVSVEHQDFSLPGRIPIEWQRTYSSGNHRAGMCGYGWETPADIRIEVDDAAGNVTMVHPSIGPLFFEKLPDTQGETAAELELMDGALLTDHGDTLCVHTKEDRIYHFAKNDARTNEQGVTEYSITRITDLCGNWLAFERYNGTLTAINESAGRRIRLSTKDGRITQITLHHPGTEQAHEFVRYEYDATGDLVAVIDALDHPYTFAYDSHRMVRHTDRNGLSFYYAYEKSGPDDWRVVHAWGDGGLYDYTFEYLDALNERRITDSLKHVSTVKLNEAGLPISEIDPLGGMTIFEYDDCGRTTAVVDPGGQRTEYLYDDRGNLLKLTRPDGESVETTFSETNKAITISDPNGNSWQQSWDARGLLIEQITPLGNLSHYAYDHAGQLTGFINPRNARTELTFDGVGNLASIKDALGHNTRFTYDLLSNVTGKTDPLGHETQYCYDAKSRLTAARLPSRATIRCAYDAEDNLTRHVDENGAETRLEYFGIGEIKRRIQPDGHTVEHHYDTEERLIGVTNQRGETYQLVRDALGRIVEEVDYWGQARRYTYDDSGYLTAAIDPLGRTIHYTTDPLGRILKKILPDGFIEEFAYDANGNLTETKNPHVDIKRRLDAEGRLIDEIQGDFCITNTYDATGNRIARETSLGNNISYEFDALDQVISICINRGDPIQVGRDAVGRIAHERLSPQVSRRFNYSADGYLTEQAVSANESPLFATRFSYDAAGNLTERNDNQYGVDIYRYDPMGRITEHLDPRGKITTYLNDPAGDRLRTRIVETGKQQIFGGDVEQNEWSREGEYEGTFYRFDRAGNLIDRRDDERDLHLVWDANQRLVESHSNGVVTRYGYDPLGRRLFKETEDKRTLFYWDGDALVGEAIVEVNSENKSSIIKSNIIDLAELSEQQDRKVSSKIREYVNYPRAYNPLVLINSEKGDHSVCHYHNDLNGCPTRLTDADGAVKWGVRYTAWGRIAEVYVEEVENPIRLQGQYEDEETGLHYNRYRYYDPYVGVFTSRDPLGLAAGINLYRYTPNVFIWSDPLGLNCGSNKKVYRELSEADRARIDAGLDLLPAGEGGSIAQQVSGRPTKYISAADTVAGTSRFRSGNGLIEIDVNEAIQQGSGFVDHGNVMQAVRREGSALDVRNAESAQEVMFKNGIPRSAITPVDF
nr:RHS repeat-associated core domain-containing protein [uncultured Desulfobacter sp.]